MDKLDNELRVKEENLRKSRMKVLRAKNFIIKNLNLA